MNIYSGECKLGVCGEATEYSDVVGKKLFVGDIVMTSIIDKQGVCENLGLTAIVSDRYTTYSDGTHKEKNGKIEFFCMGIKDVDFMDKDSKKWMVTKLKDWSNCIDGEKWVDYGFNYKQD